MFGILIVILVLILINGFFAAAEMALVSIEPSELHRIETEGRKNAKLLANLVKDSTGYLSTIQVAITLAGFLSSAFAGTKLSGALVNALSTIGIQMSQNLAVILITVILSFFTLVLGELAPKRIALSRSVPFALFAAPIIRILMILFKPFVWLLSVSTKGVLKLFRIDSDFDQGRVTEEKIKEMIVYGNIKGLYQEQETEMMQRIFRFDDLTAEMIMTPIEKVVALDIHDPNEMIIRTVVHSRYSRIPVFDGDRDHIKGVILVKDLAIRLKDKEPKDISILDLIREPLTVDHDTNINALMRTIKQRSQHLAFVIDDEGHTKGIVTLEDIVEEIIGNVYDEHDAIPKPADEKYAFAYIVDGETYINDLNATLGFRVLDPAFDEETVEDYILKTLEHVPQEDDHPILSIPSGTIEILHSESGHIDQVRFLVKEPRTADIIDGDKNLE